MEKLSIEEKAKAYDEALGKARRYYDEYKTRDNILYVEDMEDMFPELKESEDERIRKELIEMVRLSCTNGEDADKKIAWLERQGEQKSYGQRQECVDCQFNYAGECKGSCAMKRGEQTPAWSKEDEYAIERLLCLLNNEQDNYPQLSCEFQEIQEFKEWLNSLKERVYPQNDYNPYKEVVESIAEMCKHYDKASHSGLRDFYDNVKVKCKDAKEYDSLYPQTTWKPSDEQMDNK